MDRRRYLGLAGGCLWLVLVSTVFSAGSLLVVDSAKAYALLLIIATVALVLFGFGVAALRAVLAVKDAKSPRAGESSRMGRRFGAIAGAEGLLITGVTLVFVITHRWALIAPIDLIIVGLHFLPLARLFNVPRYIVTGVLFCVIPILTMVLTPSDALIGRALTWLVVPSVGCAVVAFITAWAGLREVSRFVRASRTSSP